MKFNSTILKLTGFYLLIAMILSIGFSVAIYRISSNEIGRGLGKQSTLFQNLPPRNDDRFQIDFENLRQSQIDESRDRLINNLLYFNILILMASSIGGYFFAKWTLHPLKEAIDEQNRFTADASHELKTPLAAMRSEIEVGLRDKKINIVQAKKLLNSNLEEISKLESLSKALLKLAKLDEVKRYDLNQVNLGEVITEAYEKIENIANNKKVNIIAKLKNKDVLGDRESLVELFVIILDNAVKYSYENSEVNINMDDQGREIVVSIRDKGVGIKSTDLLHIFDRFYRSDQSRNKNKVDGYGLGLSIAKRIVDLHNGHISVSSSPDKGSVFKIKFPAK